MKKLLIITAALLVSMQAFAASTAVTVAGTAAKVAALVSTNRMILYSVEVTGTQPVTVELFDCGSITAPYLGTNYVNEAYSSRLSYATNIASSYVGYNGYTNWTTNVGIFTYSNYVAKATNALSPLLSFVVAGNTYAVYNVDAIFEKGMCSRADTNASVVLNYR